ncbi:unnamed protein product [Debaryomyces tyrocola]|nr:unnamed protein product [Debaryomyces tyrocola]
MAVQLKSSRSKFKITATAGAVIVGSYIVLKTFPHLTDSIYNYLTGSGEVEEDNEPIELEEEAENQQSRAETTVGESNNESQVEISKWSDNSLKRWLKDKEINAPPNASHSSLVSLVKSIKETN